MEGYEVRQLHLGKDLVRVNVSGSKSITNRALLLAALSQGKCRLEGALFSDDSRAFLSCLDDLGFSLIIDEGQKTVEITGMGGVIPNQRASINVRSAGTAARFITVFLALAGGEYTLHSSAQMEKRPMQPLLATLQGLGAQFTYLKERNCFPFILKSKGVMGGNVTIDTEVSSQFASALLMSGCICKEGLRVTLTGNRTDGAYVQITRKMLDEFGVKYQRTGDSYFILPSQKFRLENYKIEPDFSSADYFYALGALLNGKITVEGVTLRSMQGDKKLLSVLAEMGCKIEEVDGEVVLTGVEKLRGVTVDMNDFSDQALTLAAIAPFASSPTTITGIGHIRGQECDRIYAIVNNLTRMGVRVGERADGVTIYPADKMTPREIETYDDHRVAMAFAVAGTKCGGITILNPACCQKTFENFFEVLDGLYP